MQEGKRETLCSHCEPQDLSDNNALCLGHRVSKVPQLQLMLDPQVSSVNHLSLHVPLLSVRVWAVAIKHQTFANNLSSNNVI